MTAEQSEAGQAIHGQPGETLRKARELRNMSLGDVATALHLPNSVLQNLESGAFDRLPGHTFARGYIRAYAKLLGMDQELLVREYDQATGSDALGSSVHSLGRVEEPARVSHGLLRMLSLAVLTLLILAGFLWWQDRAADNDELVAVRGIQQVEVESADGTTQIHPLEPEDQAVEVAQEEIATPAPEQAAVATGTDSVPAALAEAPAAPEVAATSAVAPAAPPPPAAEAPPAAAPEVAAATPEVPAGTQSEVAVGPGEGLLSIRFTANCWTQVTDASGKVLLSSLKRAGEDVRLVAKLPVELRLGFASGAEVSFNGKPVDTRPFSTGETARLKLGQ
jgi:cytoskeleton protein RodZ